MLYSLKMTNATLLINKKSYLTMTELTTTIYTSTTALYILLQFDCGRFKHSNNITTNRLVQQPL